MNLLIKDNAFNEILCGDYDLVGTSLVKKGYDPNNIKDKDIVEISSLKHDITVIINGSQHKMKYVRLPKKFSIGCLDGYSIDEWIEQFRYSIGPHWKYTQDQIDEYTEYGNFLKLL